MMELGARLRNRDSQFSTRFAVSSRIRRETAEDSIFVNHESSDFSLVIKRRTRPRNSSQIDNPQSFYFIFTLNFFDFQISQELQ